MEKEYPYGYAQLQQIVIQRLKDRGHPERIPNWAMCDGGAESGSTWRRNYESYQALGFRQRLIHPQLDIHLEASMCGRTLAMPVAAAPMAVAINLAHDNAFLEIAEACGRCGVAAGLGFPSGPVQGKDMVEHCANSFRIIKPHRNEEILIHELQRSQEDGCFAVGIDIDSICGLKTGDDAGHFGEISKAYTVEMLRNARESVTIPFIMKGVMSAQDAQAAQMAGADAVVVSTHAGYSLDCTCSPLEVLDEIRQAVGKDMEIYIDSGIRRGTDVLKALAMGADGVFLGRLMIWGLLLDGADGVEWIFCWLRQEMMRAMELMGISNWKELDKSCLRPLNELGRKLLNIRQ